MPSYRDWPQGKRQAYQRRWYLAHKQHNITTYAEKTRLCRVCGDEFKIHYFNRFRETCSDACHRQLMAQVTTFRGPGSLDHIRSRQKTTKNFGPDIGGDPRDEKTLVDQLFIMNWRPCEGCRGTKFSARSEYAGHNKDIYQLYCSNRSCRKNRSPRAGTIFEKTRVPMAIWIAIMRRQAFGSIRPDNMQIKTIARDFGIGRNSAMIILRKIRGRDNDDPYIRWAIHPEFPPIRGILVDKNK